MQRKTERVPEAATEAANSEAKRQNLNKTGSKRA
jgi:hypothetical protein